MKKRLLVTLPLLLILFSVSAQAYSGNFEIYFFYSEGCPACGTLSPILDDFSSYYQISVEKLELRYNNDNRLLLFNLSEAYQSESTHVPITFINNKVFIGVSQGIVEDIENEIKFCLASPEKCVNPSEVLLDPSILNETNQTTDGGTSIAGMELTLPFLLGAAAADAVNPCTFAVLILLLTAILGTGNKINALKAGIAFTIAIYFAYLAMGFGLFTAIQVSGLSTTIFKVIGVLAIVVGVLNVKDFVKPMAGGFEMAVPMSWRPRMKKIIAGATTVPGAFLIGFIVSLFLLPCTSGPYIVILTMLSNQATFWSAVPLLLLYNLIFILPMVAITLLVYWGLSSPKKAETWRLTKIKYMHLVAGLIMIGMGIAILFFGIA